MAGASQNVFVIEYFPQFIQREISVMAPSSPASFYAPVIPTALSGPVPALQQRAERFRRPIVIKTVRIKAQLTEFSLLSLCRNH